MWQDDHAMTSFHPLITTWFQARFGEPTDVQRASWPAIISGNHALIAAPTGSGKTLAAFLSCINTLLTRAIACDLPHTTQVVYISPLKALSNDVQINLRRPLQEISAAALTQGLLLPEIRVDVRTGDTPAKTRQQLLQHPPHILITTPESLFLMITAQKSRSILHDVKTVIVDEIHALAGNKRGSHLALSLERLDALTYTTPNRIGLSATQRPLEDIAHFLIGQHGDPTSNSSAHAPRQPCQIIDLGQQRAMDLAVAVPRDELGAIATNAIWADLYDQLAALVQAHRSTLVFVNTRRLAERISHHLAEHLGDDHVAAHHGSLSRSIRLSAEQRLKDGHTRVVVATASLELGIDIGDVDLVCQIGSPRAIATCLQRIGRSGHWVKALPKGRLFCTTRDELIECAALVRAIKQGDLDRITIPRQPLDILAQQIVASVATQEWPIDELFMLCRRAYPYRALTRKQFDAVIHMLIEGYIPGQGRQRALIFYDRTQHRLRARRGARLAALTSGGAIPDTATYAVVAEPQGTVVGSVDEDFAIESLTGDIMLLGNMSWRIRGIETGKVRVEDAHGAPPTIPFWRGEAPSRTPELSAAVGALRQAINHRRASQSSTIPRACLTWLYTECGLDTAGAEQAIAYIAAGAQALGTVPTQDTIIAERFFDEGGGMQLILHAPFGGRLNRAWGMALRKRFCVNFDFELQAAATDEGLVLSLNEKHSFPLDAIFQMLSSETVRKVLIQSILAAPLFIARWRWNASRALALLRFRNGRRVPLHIQRMRAEDLLSAIFPMATACQDNYVGDRPVPDHPLVEETLKDCLEDAMDLDGITRLLHRIETTQIVCQTVESPIPSPFSHEILNANPYAFLDDAPLEERRARAVDMRRMLSLEDSGHLGALAPAIIVAVKEEAWPVIHDTNDLQEVLHALIWVPETASLSWKGYIHPLLHDGRAMLMTVAAHVKGQNEDIQGWALPEHVPTIQAAFPLHQTCEGAPPVEESTEKVQIVDEQEAVLAIIKGWMEILGPTTADELAAILYISSSAIQTALLQLEARGQILRGQFRPNIESEGPLEWCDRNLLARIHRRTVTSLRREIKPVSTSDFMRFLFRWQHVDPPARLHGETGLCEILRQLCGFEAAASAWEPQLLASRLADYNPETLDYLCLRGSVTWARLTPPHQLMTPTSAAPISLFPREDLEWLLSLTRSGHHVRQGLLFEQLSAGAQSIHHHLSERGASFFTDITKSTKLLQTEVEQGLWELSSAGLVTADGFDNLRALLAPHRRRGKGRAAKKRPRHTLGRWSLLHLPVNQPRPGSSVTDTEKDHGARQLLRRYGIVFRDLLKRESLPLTWRELLTQYRTLEHRGEIRGGRFVTGLTGEQFALPEAVEALRAIRKDPHAGAQDIQLSAADPLNLVGIILPGSRIPSFSTHSLVYRNGILVTDQGNNVLSA
ncbi:MAG: DEAD/DEAH box helicase [Nitrospirales bacterium]|nr:DEAD/DEAH box helicase [Nitrospirales bacterium]